MSKDIGAIFENEAANFLKKLGYKILGQNISFVFGELDIVAQDGKEVVFVEVKHRRNNKFYEPFEAVTRAKQKKIILAAKAYLQKSSKAYDCRFDVISIVGDINNFELKHLVNAFDATEN